MRNIINYLSLKTIFLILHNMFMTMQKVSRIIYLLAMIFSNKLLILTIHIYVGDILIKTSIKSNINIR